MGHRLSYACRIVFAVTVISAGIVLGANQPTHRSAGGFSRSRQMLARMISLGSPQVSSSFIRVKTL
jgi:hypothetical protein